MAMVEIPDIPGNSITKPKAKEIKKPEVKAVAKGKVVEQSVWQRFKKSFLPGDVRDIRHHLVDKVLIPGVKGAILGTVEMILYGEVGRKRTGQAGSTRTQYSYSSGQYVTTTRPAMNESQRSLHDFRVILFDTYEDARQVADIMLEYLDLYQEVQVSTFYELCQLDYDYMDQQYGWRSFSKLEPIAVRDGYKLSIQPAPIYLGGK